MLVSIYGHMAEREGTAIETHPSFFVGVEFRAAAGDAPEVFVLFHQALPTHRTIVNQNTTRERGRKRPYKKTHKGAESKAGVNIV